MPGTSRTFTYTLIPAPGDVETVAARVRKVIGWACDGDRALTCHGITGEELGIVTFTLVAQGRDRWWATQLVQDVLSRIQDNLRDRPVRLVLGSAPPPPHDHRGYAHGRTKRTRRATAQPSSTEPTTAPGDEPFSAAVSSPGLVT